MQDDDQQLNDGSQKKQDADLKRNFLIERVGEEEYSGDGGGVDGSQRQRQDYPWEIQIFPVHQPSPYGIFRVPQYYKIF